MGKRAFSQHSRASLASYIRRFKKSRKPPTRDGEVGPDRDGESTSEEAIAGAKAKRGKDKVKQPLSTTTIIVGGIIVAGISFVVIDNWEAATEAETLPVKENDESLSLLPSQEVMDELFSKTEAGQAAAENALSFYKDRATPRLATFSKEELQTLSGTNHEVVEEAPPGIDEIKVLTDDDSEAADEQATSTNDGLDTLAASIFALRQFGGFGSNDLRPEALTSSAQVASHIELTEQYQAMSEDEISERQAAFRDSASFQTLVTQIGTRVGTHWSPPRERYSPDGAVVELSLTPNGELIEAQIQRSTGRPLYDQSVIDAAMAAAPYHEIEPIDPWLMPVLETVRLTFGEPPITPEEVERRRAAGTLRVESPTEDEVERIQAMFNGGEQGDYFTTVREQIENEWISRNPSQYDPERDAEIVVNLSTPLGVVLGIEVVKSSRDDDFDSAAKAAIDAMGPFRGMSSLISVEQDRMSFIKLHFHENGIR